MTPGSEQYPDDAIVVISPEFCIRPNRSSCIVHKNDPEQTATWWSFPTIQGVALSLFDGDRTIGDVKNSLTLLFDIEMAKARSIVSGLLAFSHASGNEGEARLLVARNRYQTFITYPISQFVAGLSNETEIHGWPASKLEAPLSLLLIPSNRCVVDCRYCYAERIVEPRSKDLPLERWLEIIDEASSLGVRLFVFSGGDPITYRSIERILRQIICHGGKFLLPTKAFVSTARAQRLAAMGAAGSGTFQVSIDGTSAGADELVRSAGQSEKALKSIQNLIEAGLRVRTNTVCTPINSPEIPSLVRRLRELGVRHASITNYARSFYRHDDALFLDRDQIDWLHETINQLQLDLEWPELRCNAAIMDPSRRAYEQKMVDWQNRARCSGGRSSMVIAPDGDVTLCEQVPKKPPFVIGNLRHRAIADVWKCGELRSFLHPPSALFKNTECEHCEEFSECHDLYGRCFRDAYFYFGTAFAPPPNCPKARAKFRTQ